MADHAMITSVPDFPVTGADLIAMGVKPGPDMGKQLNTLKQQWKASNFKATKDQLLGTT
jgi:poly(A) polymerase